jgi:hypothetical protein
MIKLENYEVMGWEHAIRGMRNPMNSWEKSDSCYCGEPASLGNECETCPYRGESCMESKIPPYIIGPNDHDLMMRLANGGPVHAKYRRMITVYVDITAPLYWWKEFDTYKVGTVANSCSTMHKIADKEFKLENFSCEHLITPAKDKLEVVVKALNNYRDMFLNFDNRDNVIKDAFNNDKKNVWWQMIQLLPSSYNQKRTVMLNYEVLAGIYKWRKNHKLDEWVEFCKWIESLPYSEIITGKGERE